jgi:hypothetical protein
LTGSQLFRRRTQNVSGDRQPVAPTESRSRVTLDVANNLGAVACRAIIADHPGPTPARDTAAK